MAVYNYYPQNVLIRRFPKGFLNVNMYTLDFHLVRQSKAESKDQDVFAFKIHDNSREVGGWMHKEVDMIRPRFEWRHK